MTTKPPSNLAADGNSAPHNPSRDAVRLRAAAAKITLAVVLSTACGFLPEIPLTNFAIGTLPPMPTLAFQDFGPAILAPSFSLPQVPEGTLQPLVGSPPDWWYLVPVHREAYAAGSVNRDYHYLVALPTEDMTAFYEQAMLGGGWETFMDTILSASSSMMSYSRDGTHVTIYISPRDGGSLVSIVIQ